jgi:hypothetical protein
VARGIGYEEDSGRGREGSMTTQKGREVSIGKECRALVSVPRVGNRLRISSNLSYIVSCMCFWPSANPGLAYYDLVVLFKLKI